MADPVILVLGCGSGGIVAAREVRQLVPPPARVIAIDREPLAAYPPSHLWLMTGERRPAAVRRHRGRLARRGIEFVNAEVRQIDVENRYVRADGREFHYDYLVLALGADLVFDSRPGVAEIAHNFYTAEGAERLAATLRYFAGGRILIAGAGTPFKFPTAPYEAAMLLEEYFHARRVRQKVEISLYTPELAPLAFAGQQNSDQVRGLLAHKGIELQTDRQLVTVDIARHEAAFRDGGVSPFNLLIAIPEHRAPAVCFEAGLMNESGWVPADPASFETAHENVFAIGDMTHMPLADGQQLPKAGIFAERQAQVVARNIAYRLGRGPQPDPFDGCARLFLETGNRAAATLEGDFMAPQRKIVMKQPSVIWRLGKVLAEKYWLWRWY